MKTMPLIETTNMTESEFTEHYALTKKPKGLMLLEVYKNHNILADNGCICVNKISDGKDYLFYVALDDSKNSGKRKFINSANNVKTAKKYIDWKTSKN